MFEQSKIKKPLAKKKGGSAFGGGSFELPNIDSIMDKLEQKSDGEEPKSLNIYENLNVGSGGPASESLPDCGCFG